MAAGRFGIPAREIEHAAAGVGGGVAPRVRPLAAGEPNAARWNSASVGSRAPRQRANADASAWLT
jgi:hypothetical protein